MIRFSSEIAKITKNLIKEYDGDIHATYAAVHNNTIGSDSDVQLIEVKQYLEYLLSCKKMEEYNWERDEMGLWHYVSSEEFFVHWHAAREEKQNKGKV